MSISKSARVAVGGLELPRRRRGRLTPESEAEYQTRRTEFCRLILQIRSTMDFNVGSRGDDAEKLITDCRKAGDLPLDVCAEDNSREAVGLQGALNDPDVESEAQSWVDYLREDAHRNYTPFGFWDDLDVYVEVAVEKLDLRNLFAPVCAEFFVPITNFKGWSDLNSRAAMMRRFAEHEAAGRRCVLLLCGDHDPGGLLITGAMRRNLEDLAAAVDWSPLNLVITRFGLNADFIRRHRLTWIDNLETSSGKRLDDPDHNDHAKGFVQDYIRRYGVRKCEANALVVAPAVGRDLCRRAILEHVPAGAPEAYSDRLAIERKRLRVAISQLMGGAS